MKKGAWVALLLLLLLFLHGCGETFRGIGRDVSRIGRGVKTVFISDSR